MKKWTHERKRNFSKEMQMAKKHMKKYSTSLALKEMQIKALRFHLTAFKMSIIKNTNNNKWRACRGKGTLIYCWWECKLL
jgi:hypothetical protein